MPYLTLLWFFFRLCYGTTYSDVTLHPNWHLLEPKTCGIVNTNRIIGGRNAAIGEFPWVAQIAKYRYPEPNFACLGTLINRLYVLTIAYCIVKKDEGLEAYGVRLGEYDMTTNPDCNSHGLCAEPYQDIGIANVVYPRDYNVNNMHEGNVGLIRMSSPAKFNAFVTPICLPVGLLRGIVADGYIFTMAGFGLKDINGPPQFEWASIMQRIRMKMVDPKICRNSHGPPNLDYLPGQLCGEALSRSRVKGGMCNNDHGAPLTHIAFIGGTLRHFLMGVGRSFHGHCTLESRPHWNDFFNTSYYEMWILDNIAP